MSSPDSSNKDVPSVRIPAELPEGVSAAQAFGAAPTPAGPLVRRTIAAGGNVRTGTSRGPLTRTGR